MARQFASGKEALGECDRCGFVVLLNSMRYETDNGLSTGVKVCEDCWDPEHPQDDIDKLDTSDPQSLQDPRPEKDESRSFFGWNPVGNQLNKLVITINDVTISTT